MDYPTDRRYQTSHEWHKLDGDICTIGISKFAADELTDITYVDLPATGAEITAGQPFGEIESVKATGELTSGASGVVVEVNEALADAPESINEDPHGAGWMIKIKASDASQVEAMMTAEAYDAQLGG